MNIPITDVSLYSQPDGTGNTQISLRTFTRQLQISKDGKVLGVSRPIEQDLPQVSGVVQPVSGGYSGGTLFASGLVSLVINTQLFSVAHGLGATPSFVRGVMVCQTAEGGYSIGDEVDLSYVGDSFTKEPSFTLSANATNVNLMLGDTNLVIIGQTAPLGSSYAITLTRWKAKVYARL